MVGSAKVRKRKHEIKREEDRHSPLFPDHALTFSRAFHLRAIPTIREPGTGQTELCSLVRLPIYTIRV